MYAIAVAIVTLILGIIAFTMTFRHKRMKNPSLGEHLVVVGGVDGNYPSKLFLAPVMNSNEVVSPNEEALQRTTTTTKGVWLVPMTNNDDDDDDEIFEYNLTSQSKQPLDSNNY
jgi:hypothetical protein